ncbi:Auxin-responsive protein IAA25 [Dichanthelium oligosanthes]|uniref:Auxin-responsive protein n=1 Tax=Dichanthelium oligosanthes TaxID=888268 RepID=A0A1E5W2A8_9POAL|nr:Auxin-responsive protein IAA25 [Dichanthelium oligosanthes]
MKSSSATRSLRLKQEQAGDGSKMQGSGLSSSLELRLGISSSDNGGGGGGDDPWLGVGVHPWNLASRQEKAAMEQAHQRPPVGWPPVGAFRKSHLAGAKAVEEPSKVKPAGSGERPAASLFVKVNLEGCAVGRKVDLQAHRGYASLSRVLQGMFHGYLSDGEWRIAGGEDDDDDGERRRLAESVKKGAKNRKTYILLYEDNEGDRMLVGDVPWELFMASVKRLYIAQDPRKN